MATAGSQLREKPQLRRVPISSIRRDGNTQHRLAEDAGLIAEYAVLMCAGVEFPPVALRWDGESYWLSDGFRRIAAAEIAGLSDVSAEVRRGELSDAQWDSYAANATHGARRSTDETEAVIRLALAHPNSRGLSTSELARHLQAPESTVRYWRSRLSSQRCEDEFRTVTRGGKTYAMATRNIGHGSKPRLGRVRRNLRAEIATMKGQASNEARGLLNIMDYWRRGQLSPEECVRKIEAALSARRGWNDGAPYKVMRSRECGNGALRASDAPHLGATLLRACGNSVSRNNPVYWSKDYLTAASDQTILLTPR